MAKSVTHSSAVKPDCGVSERKKRLSLSEKRAHQIERWHKRLAPEFPDIAPHDLYLILAALLRTPKERMQIMFLKRRKDGRYVF
jgi:hypothetical protein